MYVCPASLENRNCEVSGQFRQREMVQFMAPLHNLYHEPLSMASIPGKETVNEQRYLIIRGGVGGRVVTKTLHRNFCS